MGHQRVNLNDAVKLAESENNTVDPKKLRLFFHTTGVMTV